MLKTKLVKSKDPICCRDCEHCTILKDIINATTYYCEMVQEYKPIQKVDVLTCKRGKKGK